MSAPAPVTGAKRTPVRVASALLRPRAVISSLRQERALVLLVVIVVAAFSAVPLFFLLWNTFKEPSVGRIADFSLSNWTLSNFVRAYSDTAAFGMLGSSFFFATGSMVVAFVFGGSLAFLAERTNTPFRHGIYVLMFIPLALPGMLQAIGWILLSEPRIGVVNQIGFQLGFEQPLLNAYSLPMMFWVEGLSMAPLTFLMLGGALRTMDPGLEEAAHASGAGPFQTTSRITLRLMAPALAGIALLQFVRGMESFEIPLIMGLPHGITVFSTNIYLYTKEVYPPLYGVAFAYSFTLITIAAVGVFIYQKSIGAHEKYATITGRGYRPRLIDLGRWRLASGAFVIGFLVVSVIAPLVALIWASLLQRYQMPSIQALDAVSLENYRLLFAQGSFGGVVRNTVLLVGGVAAITMVLSITVSWVVVRLGGRGARILDSLVFSSYAVPSVAIGLSYLVLFLSFPNPIYGTVWVLILCYAASFLPIATRFTNAGVAQLGKELEDAAAASGATLFNTMKKIVIPLLLPAVVAGGLYVAILSAKVSSIAMMLYTPDSMVLSVLIYRLWTDGSIGLTAALSVLMISALLALVVGARSFLQRSSFVDKA